MYFLHTVTCEDLKAPSNSSIKCSSNNQPLQYQDRCTFQCNDGYELQGSIIRQCEGSGEWSGSRTQCNIRHCPDITTLIPNSRSCDTSYNSTCTIECEDGYNKLGDSSQYICNLSDSEIVWMFTGSGVTCSPGKVLQIHTAILLYVFILLQFHVLVSVIQRMVMSLVPLILVSSRTHVLITVIVAISWRVTDKQDVMLMGHGVVSQ